jgi:hypothetical protein
MYMTHQSKLDVYILASIVLAVILFLLGDYWIAGPVLLVLFLCAYPQRYITAPHALVIRAALARHVIPYSAIRFVGPPAEDEPGFGLTADHIRIEYGPAAEVLIEPADRDAFLRDMAARAPHLIQRGRRLIACFA